MVRPIEKVHVIHYLKREQIFWSVEGKECKMQRSKYGLV